MLDDGSQYGSVEAAFRMYQNIAQPKDIWMPHTVDIEPLDRADYTRAVSLFFNQGQLGEGVYDKIKLAYGTHRLNMAAIPQDFKRRIGWIKYDFSLEHWTLRNSKFTRAIIKDAGKKGYLEESVFYYFFFVCDEGLKQWFHIDLLLKKTQAVFHSH